jgi:hypothetical protein
MKKRIWLSNELAKCENEGRGEVPCSRALVTLSPFINFFHYLLLNLHLSYSLFILITVLELLTFSYSLEEHYGENSLSCFWSSDWNTVWFKKIDSISYGYISWFVFRIRMIYITFEWGGPKVWNTTARALVYRTAVQQRHLRTKWLQCSTNFLAFVISHPLIFLVGVRKGSSLCTTSTNNFGWPKKPYHNCGELSDARHPSLCMGWIQQPSWCYPCGRRGAYWTRINFIASIIKYTLHHICQ